MAVRYRSRIALGLTGPIERETPFGQPAIANFESIYPIVIVSPILKLAGLIQNSFEYEEVRPALGWAL